MQSTSWSSIRTPLIITAAIIVVIGILVTMRTVSIIYRAQLPVRIVIPSYNNAQWYIKNINSALTQRYNNYTIFYIDDCSSDATGFLVEQYVQKLQASRITVRCNKQRQGALANHMLAIATTEPSTIIVSLDGDDWLANEYVLADLNFVYQETGCWMTYGQFQNWPTGDIGWCCQLPPAVIQRADYRSFGFISAQPRTYYTWLARHVADADLRDETGNYFTVAGDVALMMPMLELCNGNVIFMHRILYIRNVETPLNDFKVHREQQRAVTRKIRAMPKYGPLQQ